MINPNKFEKILWDVYREAYKKAEPSADFDELVEHAPIDEEGRKNIDYMGYYLPSEKLTEIIQKHAKKNKLSAYLTNQLSIAVNLGCSPTGYKKESEEDDNKG